MLEVDRDPVTDHRLHLSQSPIGLVWVSNQIAGFKKLVHLVLRGLVMDGHSIDALVSSRICHDLISPVGAIGNGIELLEMYAAKMPEIDLIADSVENAKAKLQFFRICFGQSTDGATVGASDTRSISNAMIQTARLRLDWDLQAEHYSRENVKLLFLLLLCMETALPVGGVITIVEVGDTFVLTAEGQRVAMQDVWQIFREDNVHTVTPAQVQFLLAKAQIGNVQIENAENRLKVTIPA